MAGTFVVVEGPEGAGKSTLVRALGARLLAEGMQVLLVREPGGTPVAEAARKVALRSRHELSAAAELFLILAARADL
ncbi:MAG TPA: AAA family ATPase, partial [Gemmatimonadales bacterium]|nr:AAA family ATPase [Gemmatimonadales bacterium]